MNQNTTNIDNGNVIHGNITNHVVNNNNHTILNTPHLPINPIALLTNDKGSHFSRSMVDFYALYPQQTDHNGLSALSSTVRPSLREDIESLQSENDALRAQMRTQCDELEHYYKTKMTKRAEMMDRIAMLERRKKDMLERNLELSRMILSLSVEESTSTLSSENRSNVSENNNNDNNHSDNHSMDHTTDDSQSSPPSRYIPIPNSAFRTYQKQPEVPSALEMLRLCTRRYDQLDMGSRQVSQSPDVPVDTSSSSSSTDESDMD